jgi:hypothetical protein
MEWRKDLNKEIGKYVDDLIKKTTFFPEYRKSEKPANAQLWIALGILAKKTYEQELKIQLLEGVLKEISPKKVEKLQSREARDKAISEVERIMKEIAQRKPVTNPNLEVPKPKIRTNIVFPKLEKKTSKKLKKREIKEIKDNIRKNF